MTQHLEKIWNEFEQVIPDNTSKKQREVLKQAFMAGASQLFYLLKHEENYAHRRKLKIEIEQEFHTFANQILDGA